MRTRSLSFLVGLLLTSVVLAGTAPVQAQNRPQGSISGTVIDAETNETIPAATVEVHASADSSLVTGAITRDDGSFLIEGIPLGDYYVRIGFVGYQPHYVSDVTFDRQRRERDLGTIALQTESVELDEVEVSAEREYMEVGIDRTVYNVQNQPVTAGGSARDVLENVPSVEVDIDGNISLRGSQNVAIYLNDKPAPMTGEALTSFLEGLAADDIERVEVIPNPSARYDPEGMSGILNIVLAKDRELGWGGGVSASASTREQFNGSVNGHIQQGNVSAHANYSVRRGKRENDGSRYRENRFLDPLTILEQDMIGERGGLSNTFNASLDYQLSPRNTLSATSILSYRTRDSEEVNSYLELDADRNLLQRYDRATDGDRSDFSMDYRLDFKRVVTPREHELTVETRYEQDQEDELEIYTERLLPLDAGSTDGQVVDRQEVDQGESEREASLEVNYIRPLFGGLRLDAGYDGEYEQEENTLFSKSWNEEGVLEVDEDINDQFDYTEQTHALYGVLAGELGPFGAQVGVRAEKALTTFDQQKLGQTFDHRYFSLFPSGHLTYQPTDANTFKVSYSKRVRRPNTWQLNPLPDYDDPTFQRIGNPFLDPEYTHSFEVGYSRLGNSYTISLTPYYRRTVDEISWHEELNDEGVTILTFENFDSEESYGTELIGSLTLGQWLKGNASINAYKQVTDATNVASSLSSDALGFRSRLSLMATIQPGLILQLSQFYRSPMDIPGGRIDAFTMTDLALQQRLFDGRASVNLRASDVFNTMGFSLERTMEGYYQTFSREPNRRGLQLTFRYNFGQQERDRRRDQRPDGGEPEGGDEPYGGGM